MSRAAILFIIVCFGLIASTVPATELHGPLVIVTSFPETLFNSYKDVFEKRYPGVTVFVRSKKTSAALTFIKGRQSEPVDVFWASSPDAFEILKESGDLVALFKPAENEPARVGDYPLDDPDGYYRGFAISGYGIVWNSNYLEKFGLPVPRQWDDLKKQVYSQHIGISAPSRSGTTHLIVETILQEKGWQDGWALLLEIGGNLATITARSFGVPDGVKAGRFGMGPVIDFFGLSAKMTGAPVDFSYPDGTAFLPANIAIVKRSVNRAAAHAFVEFVLSEEGQRLLFEPPISRLPVHHQAYKSAPVSYPDPFSKELIAKGIVFDTELSRKRYHIVNELFDIMITYRLKALRRTWKAIRQAEAALAKQSVPGLEGKLKQARHLVTVMPLSEQDALSDSLTSEFMHRKPGLPVPGHQLKLEHEWRRFSSRNQATALRLAQEVLDELDLLRERGTGNGF